MEPIKTQKKREKKEEGKWDRGTSYYKGSRGKGKRIKNPAAASPEKLVQHEREKQDVWRNTNNKVASVSNI